MGYDSIDRGVALGTVGLAGTLGGTFLGGVMTTVLGLAPALWWFGGLQIFSNVGYVLVARSAVDRTLMYGGIFMYPGTEKAPGGKLRLLYEANPMGMLIEEAGGLASTGKEPILELQAEELHQRVPLYMGSKQDVQLAIDFETGAR